MELCARKNKRHRSSLRYRGAANLRYRKCWKGYNLRLNVDCHWSRAMYRLPDVLQKPTPDAILFGRDDQAGFRLDTTFTHQKHGSIGVEKTVTTHTDFVNKQSTLLQGICFGLVCTWVFTLNCYQWETQMGSYEKSFHFGLW